MTTFSWPDQWHEIAPNDRGFLEQELLREISSGHALFGLPVYAIARRFDSDDVLFAVIGSEQIAQVHLAYGGKEIPLAWPVTVLYQSLSEWNKEQTK